jgi:hypothetical protein
MKWLIYVTVWERVSAWRRILCAFGRVVALIVLLVVLINLLGPPVTIYLTARWEAKRVPGVNVAPQPLADYSVSEAPGTVLSYFGYRFEVPWEVNYKTKGTEKGSGPSGMMQIQFESGQNLLLIAPADQTGLLSELVHDKSMRMENLQLVFGDLTNRSAYDQYSIILNTAPSTIRAFGPRVEAVRGITLLTIKAIALPASLETGVFSFEFPDKRGFQIGDARKSRRVDLEVLDLNGHRVEIICSTASDATRFTQPELNRILRSLSMATDDSFAAQPSITTARRN